jgi:signal peptidase II
VRTPARFTTLVLPLILGILLADQILKIWIKTNMVIGQEIQLAPWFILHFTENPGMAFGYELGGSWGKLLLTLFRVGAIVAIGFWIRNLLREGANRYALTAVALIFAGALGNLIDSVFYGVLFSDSYFDVATFMPAEGGYAPWLMGHVVDMFYVPIFKGYLPEWVPIWGGDYMVFFRPVFNLADAAISTGVGILLVFQKRAFPPKELAVPKEPA